MHVDSSRTPSPKDLCRCLVPSCCSCLGHAAPEARPTDDATYESFYRAAPLRPGFLLRMFSFSHAPPPLRSPPLSPSFSAYRLHGGFLNDLCLASPSSLSHVSLANSWRQLSRLRGALFTSLSSSPSCSNYLLEMSTWKFSPQATSVHPVR